MSEQKFPHTVVQCLSAIAQHHGLQVNPERLIHDYALGNAEPEGGMLLRMATEIGLKARADKLSWDTLFGQQGVFPILVRLKTGAGLILVGVRSDEGEQRVAVLDPNSDLAEVQLWNRQEFGAIWDGDVVFLKRTHALSDPNQPFSLRWFIPEILKQKSAFRDIALAAMAMNLLALASPMFFQAVIDKVLVHNSEATLWVLAVGVVCALIFDGVFG
jgi:ATP-binding cassette, subfamily B, bacterial HlyB/CyaB